MALTGNTIATIPIFKHKPGQYEIRAINNMRVLVFTTLYPSAARPSHGVFVENRLRHVIAKAKAEGSDLEVKVVAPVPWFPFDAKRFGEKADFARTPKQEIRHGLEVSHPRFMVLPKMGMRATAALAKCFAKELRRLQASGYTPDLIDVHYYYPDGVAAAQVAQEFNIPFVVTARGTDINRIPQYETQKQMILNAADQAAASITVCKALKDEMVNLGAEAQKITVLRNGVDLELFQPVDRGPIRTSLGLSGDVIVSVGHLVERKGHGLIIEALAQLPDKTLLIAGSGPDEALLKALAKTHGVANRVRFLGSVPHDKLREIYSAADALVLASSREGWPNVLLEAMACGTPAIATPVWGSGEVITAPQAGRLTTARTPAALCEAINALFAAKPDRAATRAYAEQFSWDDTATGVLDVFKSAAVKSSAPSWGVNRRLKVPDAKPKLLITIDTEEIFDWHSNEFDRYKVAAPEDIDQFQQLCENAGAKPLYFITASLMSDPANARYFRELQAQGRADLGLHLHQWVTPPYIEKTTALTSYQCNLDPEIHRQKLIHLIQSFEDVFGVKPTSHRAGRYGVAPHVLAQLAQCDITYDFSPSAGFDLSGDGGPNFSGVSSHHFQHTNDAGDSITCLPATGGRMISHTRWPLAQLAGNAGSFTPLTGWRTTHSAAMRLSPEGYALKDIMQLSKSLVKNDVGLVVFSLHSTSLTLGATPYSQSRQDIDALLGRTKNYIDWFKSDLGGELWSLTDLPKLTLAD